MFLASAGLIAIAHYMSFIYVEAEKNSSLIESILDDTESVQRLGLHVMSQGKKALQRLFSESTHCNKLSIRYGSITVCVVSFRTSHSRFDFRKLCFCSMLSFVMETCSRLIVSLLRLSICFITTLFCLLSYDVATFRHKMRPFRTHFVPN